jgi:hypothetical protein
MFVSLFDLDIGKFTERAVIIMAELLIQTEIALIKDGD